MHEVGKYLDGVLEGDDLNPLTPREKHLKLKKKYSDVDESTIKGDNFIIEEYGLDKVLQTLDKVKYIECKKLPRYKEQITKYYDKRIELAKNISF